MASEKKLGLARSHTSICARKSLPPREVSVHSGEEGRESRDTEYSNYLAFVDDPKSRSPFAVLPASRINCVKQKHELDATFLNDNRRKRKYDLAFTDLFKHTCRIFAKCESTVPLVRLHEIVQNLNSKFNLLMNFQIDPEDALTKLIAENARKVQDGIRYDTGDITNKRARLAKPPDTTSSYTDDSANENNDGNECSRKIHGEKEREKEKEDIDENGDSKSEVTQIKELCIVKY